MPRVPRSAPRNVSRPNVILDAEFEDGQLFLVLENIGGGCAHGIVTEFDRPLRGVGGCRDVTALGVFRRLMFMPPGKRIRVFLDTAASYFQRNEPGAFEARIHYRDDGGRKHTTRLKHDLSAFVDLGYVRKPA